MNILSTWLPQLSSKTRFSTAESSARSMHSAGVRDISNFIIVARHYIRAINQVLKNRRYDHTPVQPTLAMPTLLPALQFTSTRPRMRIQINVWFPWELRVLISTVFNLLQAVIICTLIDTDCTLALELSGIDCWSPHFASKYTKKSSSTQHNCGLFHQC